MAVLLPGVGSVQPAGTATAAVFDNEPAAAGDTVPVTVKVACRPDRRSTVVATSPEPEAAPQAPSPGATVHVHDTPVSAAGITSLTGAPTTSEGPLFATVTV